MTSPLTSTSSPASHTLPSANPTTVTKPPSLQQQPHQQSQTTAALEDILFGSLAGSIGKILEYPFDTIKVRLQSQRVQIYKNSWDCLQQSVRSDGVLRGLYRGLSAPIVGAAVETSSLFFSYRLSQDVLLQTIYRDRVGEGAGRDDLPMDALLLAGSISGAVTSLWLTPIELVKCQMQVPLAPGSVHGPGVGSVIGNILKHKGPAGFWHGQMGTLFRETGGSAAWFGVYEAFKKVFRKRNAQKKEGLPIESSDPQLMISQRLLAGAAAGVAYNFAFFPADTIKSRMQTESVGPGGSEKVSLSQGSSSAGPAAGSTKSGSNARSPDFWTTARIIWREAGIRGLYRGCGVTVARSTLSSPIIFYIYESLKGWREGTNVGDQ